MVCEHKKGSRIPRVLALVKKESRGLRRGYVVNFEEAVDSIGEAITEAERAAKTKIREVFLGVGGITLESKMADGSVVVGRADSEVSDMDMKRVFEVSEQGMEDSNRKIILSVPLYFKIDGQKVLGRPQGMHGSKLEARMIFITCLTQHIQDLVQAVEQTGVYVEDVVASPLAASLVTLSKVQKTSGSVLVNIGSQTTSIVIFEDSIPISLHVFPVGSNDITNDIALGLKVPIEEAEYLKTSDDESPSIRKKLDEIIQARMSDIFDFIEGHLKKIGRNELLPAGVIITGGGGNMKNVEELAKNHLKLPARIAAPNVEASSKGQIRDSAWAVAYGLCIYGADFESGHETFGSKMLRQTKGRAARWLKELLP